MAQQSSSDRRNSSTTYRRIVVKAGTHVVTGGGDGLDLTVMAALVDQMARLRSQGREVLLVSSGAVAAGRQALGYPKERRDVPFRQVLASVGQSRLMNSYQEMFAGHDLVAAQALLTRADIADVQGYLNIRDTLLALLDAGVVPVINENDVVNTEEIGEDVFGDNDMLSALVSNLVDADLLVILTDTDGLYTADPAVDPNAELIPRVDKNNVEQVVAKLTRDEIRHPWSRGGITTKIEAARLATSWGVEVVLARGANPQVLLDVAAGRGRRTVFVPTASKMESRKRWFLSGLSTRGEIRVDSGAASALRTRNSSLLPVGVREVGGNFNRRDVVMIVDDEGKKVACGVTNYSSEEVAAIKGLRSDKIEETLGHRYGEEVVHRNNLAVL